MLPRRAADPHEHRAMAPALELWPPRAPCSATEARVRGELELQRRGRRARELQLRPAAGASRIVRSLRSPTAPPTPPAAFPIGALRALSAALVQPPSSASTVGRNTAPRRSGRRPPGHASPAL